MITTLPGPSEVTRRDVQMLRAVQVGRASIDHGQTLLIDGRQCCDQIAGMRLIGNRLVAPALPGQEKTTVRAQLTDTGVAALVGGAR